MQPDARFSDQQLLEIESDLLRRLAAANAAYQDAKAKVTRLHQLAHDLGPGHSDGYFALRHAIRIERTSFKRYAEALRSFNEFILRYKPPRDLTGAPPGPANDAGQKGASS